MKSWKLYFSLLLALLLVACGGAAEETAVEPSTSETTTTEEMTDESEEMMDDSMDDEEMMEDESMDDDMAMTDHDEGMAELEETMEETEAMDEEMADEAAMGDLPLWMTTVFTDVRTGETFTFADFAGKTVFVEPMATWCTNCRRQLGNVSVARATLGDTEDVIFISLSVETRLSNENLASYTDETGFHWTFAVLTPEALVSLADTFGQTVTNPPSTPSFLIRPDGTTTDLETGFEEPDQLLQRIEAASQS
ncbi:TlpA family protein disulfide reductase [Candidatus Leptofilum sp.]|uniref:TlpA family protein disulfide reductase n=1 Tax=Candidatus Leptofilum sp. TaxID=3241576 RepID=UPI003B5C974F